MVLTTLWFIQAAWLIFSHSFPATHTTVKTSYPLSLNNLLRQFTIFWNLMKNSAVASLGNVHDGHLNWPIDCAIKKYCFRNVTSLAEILREQIGTVLCHLVFLLHDKTLPTACRLFLRGVIFTRSRFARSTIPEEKWGTTRSLKTPWNYNKTRLLKLKHIRRINP